MVWRAGLPEFIGSRISQVRIPFLGNRGFINLCGLHCGLTQYGNCPSLIQQLRQDLRFVNTGNGTEHGDHHFFGDRGDLAVELRHVCIEGLKNRGFRVNLVEELLPISPSQSL